MNAMTLLGRRIAGAVRAIFGRRRAQKLLKELKKVDISTYVTRIVSDAVLMNGIPSPTENEKERMDFIVRRLTEFGVSNIEVDTWGNVAALFPAFGTRDDFTLVTAEVGDSDYSPQESSVRLTEDRAIGSGIGERSLGAAALLVLAEFAQATGFHLDKNLLLLFTKSSSVDDQEEAFRGFLDAWAKNISCGVMVRGRELGIVESRQVGSYHLTIDVKTRSHELLAPGATMSAAAILGSIASQIDGISWDERHSALVNIARMEAGTGYGHWPSEGSMDLEIVSEEESMLETIKNVVSGTIAKIAAGSGGSVESVVRSRHSVGDSMRNAPITDALRNALSKVRIKPEIGIISEPVSILNDYGIPATAVGITRSKGDAGEESIDLSLVETGFRQLLMLVESCSTIVENRGRE